MSEKWILVALSGQNESLILRPMTTWHVKFIEFPSEELAQKQADEWHKATPHIHWFPVRTR